MAGKIVLGIMIFCISFVFGIAWFPDLSYSKPFIFSVVVTLLYSVLTGDRILYKKPFRMTVFWKVMTVALNVLLGLVAIFLVLYAFTLFAIDSVQFWVLLFISFGLIAILWRVNGVYKSNNKKIPPAEANGKKLMS